MGTLVKITLYAADEDEARAAFAAGFSRIRELDDTLSDYKPGSELNRITTSAVGTAVGGSRDLIRVLAASQDLAAATGGAFDITQGPVIRLWREARAARRLPDDERVARRLGAERLPETSSRSGGRNRDGGPGGHAPGRRSDRQGLRRQRSARRPDCARGTVRAGRRERRPRVQQRAPGARGWRVHLHSVDLASEVPTVVELTNAAVSTAGASEQHLDAGGRRYSHIVDPATRTGVTDDITVTVVAKHGLDADGLDTAVSVLGVEKGLALIESRPDAAALIVRRTPEGTRLVPSSRFRALAASRRGLTLPHNVV